MCLHQFSRLPGVKYLWPRREKSDVHPLFHTFCQQVEALVALELPVVASAFRLGGYVPSALSFSILLLCCLLVSSFFSVACP